MKEHEYIPLGSEHTVTVGKTTFIVNSFADKTATKTAEQLIMELLKSKISDIISKEESA